MKVNYIYAADHSWFHSTIYTIYLSRFEFDPSHRPKKVRYDYYYMHPLLASPYGPEASRTRT